jgi:hypothetical protein
VCRKSGAFAHRQIQTTGEGFPMEQANDRPGDASGSAGDGNSPPLIPAWQEIAMLLLKAERLAGAAAQAIEAGASVTAARMAAEATAAIHEAIQVAERARAQ